MPSIPKQPAGGLPRSFRPAIVEPDVPVRETGAVSFGDLVRMVAEGIADGQASLDRSSAELVTELAASKVQLVPSITETIAPDGTITFAEAAPVEVSLLSIGVTPTFYQFSQATVEVAMDIHIVETGTESGEGKRRIGLFAGTASVRAERKLNRDVTVHSKLTATLVPVPMPLRVDPIRNTIAPGS